MTNGYATGTKGEPLTLYKSCAIWLDGRLKKMITCCLNCTSRHQACYDTCEKYKAEKKDFEERKAFVHELNHSQSVYHRNYEDKHRERGKKRFLGSEFGGE